MTPKQLGYIMLISGAILLIIFVTIIPMEYRILIILLTLPLCFGVILVLAGTDDHVISIRRQNDKK